MFCSVEHPSPDSRAAKDLGEKSEDLSMEAIKASKSIWIANYKQLLGKR